MSDKRCGEHEEEAPKMTTAVKEYNYRATVNEKSKKAPVMSKEELEQLRSRARKYVKK